METPAFLYHHDFMWGSEEVLKRVRPLANNVELARLLGLPPPRISELYKGTRNLKLEEAKVLVEHFHLERAPESPRPAIEAEGGATKETIGSTLLELKARSGLSLRQIASASGYAGASSLQVYFSSEYSPSNLPQEVAAKLAGALTGKGNPPIKECEVLGLALTPPSALASISTPVAEAFIRQIAKRFVAGYTADDVEVQLLAKCLLKLAELSQSHPAADPDGLVIGILAGADATAEHLAGS